MTETRPDQLTSVDVHSVDITAENIQKLKELFPEVLTEKKIDFEKLRLILGDEVDNSPEKYSFTWNGKKQAMKLAQKSTTATLKPNKEKSKNWDETKNIYIEGDNLEVLKLLQKSYSNKVKMIYVDPPYNTGGDFVYKDSFGDNLNNYLEQTGQIDSQGNKLSTNSDTDGRYHTNWLNMMYPRLKLARNLLTEDGVIFISIDDKEVDNLRKVCDEIFGPTNFVNAISVKMSESSGVKMAHTSKRLPKLKEYVLIYKKKDIILKDIKIAKEKWDDEYKSIMTEITEEEWNKMSEIISDVERSESDFTFVKKLLDKANYMSLSKYFREKEITSNEEKNKFKYANAWRIFRTVSMGSGTSSEIVESRRNLLKKIFFPYVTSTGQLYVIKGDFDESSRKPRMQVLFAQDYLSYHPGDFWTDIKTTGLDNEGGIPFKNGKKPLALIQRLIDMATDSNDVILDFFSGSGTTAEAIMKSSATDNKNHNFILVQLPESLEESLKQAKDNNEKKVIKNTIDFLDGLNLERNITQIGEERIRRAGKKIISENPDLKGKLDIGFKVFELSDSNIKKWNVDTADLNEQIEMQLENIHSDANNLDLVYEIMLKQGLDLNLPIEEIKVDDATIYKIAYGALFIVLGSNIKSDVASKIINIVKSDELEEVSIVLQDTGFVNDSEKLNAIEILNAGGVQYDDILSV